MVLFQVNFNFYLKKNLLASSNSRDLLYAAVDSKAQWLLEPQLGFDPILFQEYNY